MKRARGDAGFTLAGLICVMTAVAVTSAVMVPLRVMESQREREKELIFRGEEYVRAIQKYQRKYQAYPAAIDDLISRDGYRFLRKQYKDPISGEDFRLINVNPDLTLTGSTTMLSLPVSAQNGGRALAPGNIGGAAGTLPSTGAQTGGGNGQTGTSANTNSIGNVGGLGGSMGSGTNSGVSGAGNPFGGGGGAQNNNAGGRAGVGNSMGSGVGTGGGAFGGGTFGGGAVGVGGMGSSLGTGAGGNGQQQNGNNNGRPNNGTGSGLGGGGGATGPGAASAIGNNPFTGGGAITQVSPGVAGVGSQSTGTGVMLYNTKDKYNEWEFITPLEQTAANQGAGGPGGGGNNRPGGGGPGFQPAGGGVGAGGGFGVGGGGGGGVGGGGGGGVGGIGGGANPFGAGGGQQGGTRPGGGGPAGGTTGGGGGGGGAFGGGPVGVGGGGGTRR